MFDERNVNSLVMRGHFADAILVSLGHLEMDAAHTRVLRIERCSPLFRRPPKKIAQVINQGARP